MKPRHLFLAAALALAALVATFGDKTPVNTVAEPVVRSTPAARNGADARRSAPAAGPQAVASAEVTGAPSASGAAAAQAYIIPLRARAELIGEANLKGDAVFGSQNWAPPPPPAPAKAAPPAPPMAPPLPFTYLGKALQDGRWEVYLSRGSMTYIVQNKTVLEGAYRVDAITPPTMTLTYLPLNQVQQLNIGVLD